MCFIYLEKSSIITRRELSTSVLKTITMPIVTVPKDVYKGTLGCMSKDLFIHFLYLNGKKRVVMKKFAK
jgi:hypothetical protein